MLRRMFEKRLREYRAKGYALRGEELAGASPAEERTIIYDSDPLSSAD